MLYLPDLLANHLWPLDLPLVSKHCKCQVADKEALAQAPNKRDGVKKVGISAARIDPEIIEGRA